MKKFLAIIIVISSLFFNVRQTNFTLLDYFDGEITYYSNSNFNQGKCLGFCYASSEVSLDKVGESIILLDAELNSIISALEGEIIKTEWVEDRMIVYAFSDKIPNSINLFDTEINLQISYTPERTVVGWPLILGDF